MLKPCIEELTVFIRVKIDSLNDLSKEIPEIVKNEDINKYFLSLLFLILSVFLLSVLLSIYDFSFENSIKLAVLTLLNTVNSTNYIPEQINFENLSVFTKYLLIIFMMIGRIELLTIVIFLKKIFIKY